jgi:hypothetical protein
MTPGYRIAKGLPHAPSGWSAAHVNRWRTAYIDARAKANVTGFGEYDFLSHNAASQVMTDVLAEMGAALR